MKKLNELLNCEYDIIINTIVDDSREVLPNSLFFCIEGLTHDGHNYVDDAVNNGAVAIVSNKNINVSVPVIYVDNTNEAMVDALNNFYDKPLSKLDLIGCTGTDGKTTTTSIIYQLLNNLGTKTGVIGTNGARYPGSEIDIPGHLTTPLPTTMFSVMDILAKNDCKNVIMEVSSERLLTKRIDSLRFGAAIFTNVSNDHLNIHKTVENYVECKCKLFRMVNSNGICVINIDDKYADMFIKNSSAKVITYGIEHGDVYATNIKIETKQLSFKLNGVLGEYEIVSPISGKYNVYNVMAAIITVNHLGYSIEQIVNEIKNLIQVEGRSIIVEAQDYNIIIDYAHNPNALKNLLEYANEITTNRVITVTGSAGGRDASKRPIMGEIVINNSDYVIFTEDDPRYEDPIDIVEEMIAPFKDSKNNYEIEVDRRLAIRKAVEMASKGDTIVIAGRGNDTNMPVGNGYEHLNDFEEVQKNIN